MYMWIQVLTVMIFICWFGECYFVFCFYWLLFMLEILVGHLTKIPVFSILFWDYVPSHTFLIRSWLS